MTENRIKTAPTMGKEVWELQTEGTLWVQESERKDQTMVQGKGARLRISTEDRQLTQERIRQAEHDPFTNGMLVRTDKNQNDDPETTSVNAKTDDELSKILTFKQAARFQKEIEALSELAIRRLKIVAEEGDASLNQLKAINELIQNRYSVDKSTRYETQEFMPKEIKLT